MIAAYRLIPFKAVFAGQPITHKYQKDLSTVKGLSRGYLVATFLRKH
jgi:hypothetical protein